MGKVLASEVVCVGSYHAMLSVRQLPFAMQQTSIKMSKRYQKSGVLADGSPPPDKTNGSRYRSHAALSQNRRI